MRLSKFSLSTVLVSASGGSSNAPSGELEIKADGPTKAPIGNGFGGLTKFDMGGSALYDDNHFNSYRTLGVIESSGFLTFVGSLSAAPEDSRSIYGHGILITETE